MNIERFAGENEILQKMNAQLQQNEQRMQAQQAQAMQISERQTQRDVAAAFGKVGTLSEADFL